MMGMLVVLAAVRRVVRVVITEARVAGGRWRGEEGEK